MNCHVMLQLFLLIAVNFHNYVFGNHLYCYNNLGSCRISLQKGYNPINQDVMSVCPGDCKELLITSISGFSHDIYQTAFQNFSFLSHLSIRMNLSNMHDFQWISSLMNLISLDLSHCNLRSIYSSEYLDKLHRLVEFDLSFNNLDKLPHHFVSTMPKLQKLNISNNKFAFFPDLSSSVLSVDITDNPLLCTCTNVQLSSQVNFLTSNFTCNLPPCPYFPEFQRPLSELTVEVAETFRIYCEINASIHVRLGLFSPIGFIPGPSLESSKSILYSYVVQPIQRPVKLMVENINNGFELTVDYARGHHAGEWQCGVLSGGTFLPDNQTTLVTVRTGIDNLFFSTTITGLIVMGVTLLLGLIIGATRYLVETHCFTRPQSHKYVGRPLIGIIPVPLQHTQSWNLFEDISLSRRVCSHCLTKPGFHCSYCFVVHEFSLFEVSPFEDDILTKPAPPYTHGNHVTKRYVAAPSLLENGSDSYIEHMKMESGVDLQESTWAKRNDGFSENEIISVTSTSPHPRLKVLNYDFPSEFCHCCHLNMRSAPPCDVKLIFHDHLLAEEYTEALQALQAAASSFDAATFRSRLEEFREKLMHDVGNGVRVVRQEMAALKDKSEKSVAHLKDQSNLAAHRIKAGLSQVKDEIRGVTEMSSDDAEDDGNSSDIEAIGQSIFVVSLYKDDATNETKERYVSDFQF